MIEIDAGKILEEISDKSFIVVNPKNTYKYISVIEVRDILDILSKYTNNKEEK